MPAIHGDMMSGDGLHAVAGGIDHLPREEPVVRLGGVENRPADLVYGARMMEPR
jgi:hypothetical protein